MAEIMAPVGSFEMLASALKAGCGSVYFGVNKLNMRAGSVKGFTLEDLPLIVEKCKKVKTYLALNIILYDDDIAEMKTIVDAAKNAGITAVICTDAAALEYCKQTGMPVHISTQCNVSNLEAVKFFANYAETIVLARELTLEQIKNIVNAVRDKKITSPSGNLVKIEIFVHGALCVSISGKCYMSLAQYNRSANRGECLQPCRRSYKVIDEETGDELVVDNNFIMSPKDLCCIRFLDKILDSGVSILKIEGRGRSPDYVYTVVKCYKEAVDAVVNGTYTPEKIDSWEKELLIVFNRGFWHGGYYLGSKIGEWAGVYGSKATKKKIFIGTIRNYYLKNKIAHAYLEAGDLKLNDEILITGITTGVVKGKITSLIVDEKPADTAEKGTEITFPIEKVRENDKLFKLIDR